MAETNRELRLEQALSGLVDSYYEIHSNEENCPACGNEYIADIHGLTPSIHDDTCPLAIAIKLIAPQEKIQSYMGSQSPRWNNWVRPEGIDTLEKMGFSDSSWGDDACPSWTHEGLDMVVYVDLPVEFSEVQSGSPTYKQYIVNHDGEPGDTILMTNDFSDILSYISEQSCITGPDGLHACNNNGNPCHCQCAECYPGVNIATIRT